MQETLPPSPTPSDSSVLSPTPSSCFQLTVPPPDFEEAPLAALTERPLHLLSEEELRSRVQALRAERQSHQTFRASRLREAEEEEAREPKAPKTKKTKALAEVSSLFDSLGAEEPEPAPAQEVSNLFDSL